MKAEILMIGDWVKTNPNCGKLTCGIKSNIAMVSEIGFSNSDGMYVSFVGINGRYYDNELEPIPLTSEVLEKNSFLKVEAIEYPSHSVGISFLYRNTPEGLRIFVQNACAGGPTCTMIKTCKYVHEVQHMIKMCDIERTFVL